MYKVNKTERIAIALSYILESDVYIDVAVIIANSLLTTHTENRPSLIKSTHSLPLRLSFVTSSNVLRKGSWQTKLNAGLSEQRQEDLFQNERSFHKVNSKQHVLDKLTRPPPT